MWRISIELFILISFISKRFSSKNRIFLLWNSNLTPRYLRLCTKTYLRAPLRQPCFSPIAHEPKPSHCSSLDRAHFRRSVGRNFEFATWGTLETLVVHWDSWEFRFEMFSYWEVFTWAVVLLDCLLACSFFVVWNYFELEIGCHEIHFLYSKRFLRCVYF